MGLFRAGIVAAFFVAVFSAFTLAAGERINHAGRILPDTPAITAPLLFNTPQADAVISSLQILPRDNPWNEDISRRPLLANSAAMIAQITSDITTTPKTLHCFYEMNFVVVPAGQAKIPIAFTDYPDESDPSPYPIPSNMPVEGWPKATGNTLVENQTIDDGSDRHSIIVDPGNGYLYETWRTVLNGGNWQAANGARFELNTNNLRPDGWTSGDAAGLSMFAGLVRYDECQRGTIEHALRCIVKATRKQYIYPATHFASSSTNPDRPAMGQRLRLKASFAVPDAWTKEEKAVCAALKKFGCIVADNGNFFSISVAPDDRFSGAPFSNLEDNLALSNFEAIQTTGPAEGPRSPGAPSVDAGPDRTLGIGFPANLSPIVNGTSLALNWKLYSGPGTVVFADASAANTTATFSALGVYTLMLSADDGVHTPAYDALVVTVTSDGGADTTPPGSSGGGPGGGGSGGTGSATDMDGDGFSDELELALGTSVTDGSSTPFGGAPAGTVQPLEITKLGVRLNFSRTGKDGISLSGTIPVPDGATATGQTLVVDVGGDIEIFELDARGKGAGARGTARLGIRAKKGVVLAQNARLRVRLKGDLAQPLLDEGFSGTADARNESRNVYVQVLFNRMVFTKLQAQLWTAKAGKSGRSK